MRQDLLYQLSLTLVPHIGPVQAKILLQHCEPEEIFHAKKIFLEKIEGIGTIRAESIKKFNGFDEAEAEIRFIEKNNIQPLFVTDTDYPKRLINRYESPTLSYYKCHADLKSSKNVAIDVTANHNT